MKNYLFVVLCLVVIVGYGQKIDTVINAGIYKSYFSYELKGPAYVSYKLYKGGGGCNRGSTSFKKVGLKYEASDKDYKGSGYDKGHLANAEDFANDCASQVRTFRYDNCLPQNPKLNRGVWKKFESSLRKISQKDSLLIVCGGIFDTIIIGNKVSVPSYCWKVAKKLSSGEVVFCGVFPNDSSNSMLEIKDDDYARGSFNDLISGKISYDEFVAVVRTTLGVESIAMPKPKKICFLLSWFVPAS